MQVLESKDAMKVSIEQVESLALAIGTKAAQRRRADLRTSGTTSISKMKITWQKPIRRLKKLKTLSFGSNLTLMFRRHSGSRIV